MFTPIRIIQLAGLGFVLLLGLMVLGGSFYSVGAGQTSIVQNTLNGDMSVVRGPKLAFKLPFFTSVETYVDVSTITFGSSTDQNTRNEPAINVRFADTYRADIEMSFRFRLPTDDAQMIRIHRDYRRYDNMVDNLFVKNAVNVTTVTATQFTGEEFFQGGVNTYKERLEDQMKAGIYQTERQQVEIEGVGIAPITGANTISGTLQNEPQLVWKTVPIVDANGNPIRQSNPFQAYGIEVTQLTYTAAQPEELLDKLLVDKKTLVAQRIRTIQEQETVRAEADTEQLRKEIERTKAVQDANRIRELAVIAEQQQVQVAEQQALKLIVDANRERDLAVIDKERELAIAQANEGIQEATYNAAVYQAQAIKEVGFAEVEVLNARYAALGANSPIYMAEMQRDVSLKLYENLGSFNIQMPTNMVTTGGEGGLSTNLDILSSYAALGSMDRLSAATQAP